MGPSTSPNLERWHKRTHFFLSPFALLHVDHLFLFLAFDKIKSLISSLPLFSSYLTSKPLDPFKKEKLQPGFFNLLPGFPNPLLPTSVLQFYSYVFLKFSLSIRLHTSTHTGSVNCVIHWALHSTVHVYCPHRLWSSKTPTPTSPSHRPSCLYSSLALQHDQSM